MRKFLRTFPNPFRRELENSSTRSRGRVYSKLVFEDGEECVENSQNKINLIIMKKFLLSIFAVLFAFAGVQAEEVRGTITFKTSSSDSSTAATVANFVTGQVADNGGFTLSCTATNNCYTGKSGLKLSSSSKNGSFTLGLGGTYNVKSIIVNALRWKSSEAATISVNSSSAKSLTETAADYVFEVNSEISQIKLDVTKRVYICSVTIIYEVAGEGGGETPDVPVVETVATPIITAETTTFNEGESVFVSIATETQDAEIYYTLDGTDPSTENGELYEGEIEITETTTVKAIAVKEGWNDSEVAEATFTAVDPNAKTATFDFTKPAELTPSVTTFTGQAYNTTGTTFTSDGVTLNTTDGSTASRIWEGTSAYDLRVYKNATMTIAAPTSGVITSIEFTGSTVSGFSADSGTLEGKKWTGNASKVVFTWSSSASTQKINTITVTYSIDENAVVIAQPSLTPATSFVGSTTVEITNNEEGTTLYYSTNGEEYAVYTGALNITETTTVYAKAVDAQGNESAVAEATYTKLETMTIAEAKAAYDAAGANVDVAMDLTGAVVTVNSGQYMFIENETTGINIYNSGAKYAVGTKFTSGYILGASAVYGKMHQITNAEFNNVETTTIEVVPTEVAVADLNANFDTYEGRFVRLTDADINGKNIAQGENAFALYNRFDFITAPTSATGCDIEGIVARYNTTLQIFPVSISNTINVTEAGFATLYLAYPVVIPADVKAYTVTGVGAGYVTLTQVTGVLPANTGVIVEAGKGSYDFVYSADEATAVTDNKLLGSAVNTYVNGDAYVLGNVNGIGLYKAVLNKDADGAEGTTHFLNNANKAYLPASVASGAASYSFRFGEGTTGVENVVVENEVKVIYDLTGSRVETITEPGIYIVNGVKKLVR